MGHGYRQEGRPENPITDKMPATRSLVEAKADSKTPGTRRMTLFFELMRLSNGALPKSISAGGQISTGGLRRPPSRLHLRGFPALSRRFLC